MLARFREFAQSLFREKGLSWTAFDQARALAQGWGLFVEDESLELQAGDTRHDHAAWVQVVKAAQQNDALSMKALRVLAAENPAEHQLVTDYARLRLPN